MRVLLRVPIRLLLLAWLSVFCLEWPFGGGRPDLPLLLHADDVGSIRCSCAFWR